MAYTKKHVKHRRSEKKVTQVITSEDPKQMPLMSRPQKWRTMDYFNLWTLTKEQLVEDGQVSPKQVVHFNFILL